MALAFIQCESEREPKSNSQTKLDFKQLQRTDFKPTNDFFNVLTFFKKKELNLHICELYAYLRNRQDSFILIT